MPGGTTILQAIRNTVSAKTQVTFSIDGSNAEGADVAVVVIGEKPYAEGRGDRADLSWQPKTLPLSIPWAAPAFPSSQFWYQDVRC